MSHSLNWNISLGKGQVEALMAKVTLEKSPSGLNSRNRYVLFYPLS